MYALLLAVLVLFAVTALGAIREDEVRYEAGGTKLRGAVVYDDAAPGKPGGIVIFPEWWGANDYPRRRAHMLAELGYVAFVADMYGDAKTTADPKEAASWAQAVYGKPEVMLARAQAAVQALRNTQKSDAQRIAAIGYCMGGSVALNLARAGEDLKSVVAFHAGLASRLPQGTPEQIRAKIVVLNGADDKMVSSDETQKFMDEMRQVKADWELVLFGNTVHAYTNPNADKYTASLGIAYNQQSDKRSWEILRLTLRDTLGPSR